MSSHQHKRASSSTPNSSNMLRLSKMRPIATTAKKLTSKIKSIRILRIFRTRAPTDIPFSERDVRHVTKFHRKTDSGKTESANNRTQDDQHWRMRILSNDVQAIPREQWNFSSEKVDKADVDEISVSGCDGVDLEFHVTDVCEDAESDSGPPSYVTIIKGLRRVSQDRQFSTHDDLTFDEMDPSDWTQDIDGGRSCETFYTAISEARWMTNEPESVQFEIDLMKTEIQLTTPGSDQSQQQSSLLSTGDSLARVLFPNLEVQKDTTSAYDKTATGLATEISCETVESNDDVDLIPSLKKNESSVSHESQDISKATLDDVDEERAERIERRRKLLAKKKEARLKWAMENNAREVARIGNTCPNFTGLKLDTQSPDVDNGAHMRGSLSEESKTEDEFAHVQDNALDPVEWSKDEARKAKERRKLGQKERLLNLLSGCIILHTGSTFETTFEGDRQPSQLAWK